MKITIDIRDAGQLLAWQRAFETYGMPDKPCWHRSFAHSLINMATEALATTDHPHPAGWPMGKFEYRPTTPEEENARLFLHRIHMAELDNLKKTSKR